MADVGRAFLEGAVEIFGGSKALGDGVLGQLDEAELRHEVGHDANSVAVIVKHLHGNMLSRWTDFLTTDGEKATRERDDEFVPDGASRAEVLARWDEGWAAVFAALASLAPGDLAGTVRIRGELFTVPKAILRQIEHYGYHVGQMVLIGKSIRGESWQTLTVPRGGTAAYNASVGFDPKA